MSQKSGQNSTSAIGPSIHGRRKLPVLFLGHGSPMNALADNAFTRCLNQLGATIPTPRAVLCISAHWVTQGISVTHMAKPKTIHDFGGFPQRLFDVQYPAPGSPEIAELVATTLEPYAHVHKEDVNWGLDHGCWSVLLHLYPRATIPVVQLSIDLSMPLENHFRIGEQLRALREQGVLIVGSGNVVHNLRQIDFSPKATPFEWATEFDYWVKQRLQARDHRALVAEALHSRAGELSIPTLDHWIPLLTILGASENDDQLQLEYEGIEYGSISMLSLSFGLR
jgi:4,5-DOPA dioxygenase extradiol